MGAAKKKRGAPTKGAQAFDHVLFVRTNKDLLDALDALVERERKEKPGRSISRADVARDLLYQGTTINPRGGR